LCLQGSFPEVTSEQQYTFWQQPFQQVKDGRTICEHRRGFFEEQGRSALTICSLHAFLPNTQEKSLLQNWKKEVVKKNVSLSME